MWLPKWLRKLLEPHHEIVWWCAVCRLEARETVFYSDMSGPVPKGTEPLDFEPYCKCRRCGRKMVLSGGTFRA